MRNKNWDIQNGRESAEHKDKNVCDNRNYAGIFFLSSFLEVYNVCLRMCPCMRALKK